MGTVLVVDDSALTRYLLTQILISGGHEVVGEAGDGVEALQKVGELKPEVVILDMIMPKMKGLETLDKIKASNPDTKVIICTGDTQEYTVRNVVRSGASGFITKPFKKDAVLGEVGAVLAGIPR